MIVAIEGPNCSGKTTLWRELVLNYMWPDGVTCVSIPEKDPALFPVMDRVQRRHEHIWRAMYDPARMYLCDRHFVVSSQVYDRLYGRELMDIRRWIHQMHVYYLEVPIHVLEKRWDTVGETFPKDKYQTVLDLYEEVAEMFPYWTVLSGVALVRSNADKVYEEVMRLWRK